MAIALQMRRYGNTGYQLGCLIADHLPKRQAEALLYTGNGYTDKLAAAEMQCAADTVKHLRLAVHNKCNSHNGAELVARAFEKGYLRLAVILLAWTIGFGAVTTPAPAKADDGDNQMLRFRNRRARGRSRQDNGLYWDEETGTLIITDGDKH